jgi:hypothetical protein
MCQSCSNWKPDRCFIVQEYPDAVSISIEQAPMDWALPVRKEQNLRPPFRVSVVVKSAAAAALPLKVTPHVLTEEEAHNGVYVLRLRVCSRKPMSHACIELLLQ